MDIHLFIRELLSIHQIIIYIIYSICTVGQVHFEWHTRIRSEFIDCKCYGGMQNLQL